MNKIIAVSLTIGLALMKPVAAQQAIGTVAHDYCQLYDWDQGVVCGVFLVSGDGSTSAYVAEGTEPAWSRDGTRVAFVEYLQPSIAVLNIADWSIARISGLTSVSFVGHPAWSPDGATIVFECEIEAGNRDICTIGTDGTGLIRLTSGSDVAAHPIVSVDGTKIAFTDNGQWFVIYADGSGVTTAAVDEFASPSGTRPVYVVPFQGACEADGRICPDTIYIENSDGTFTAIAFGNNPAWALSHQPIAAPLSRGCDGGVCGFDGSGSWIADGTTLVDYAWDFGDGTTASGTEVSHAYAANGTYSVSLTVTTSAGVTSTRTVVVDVDGTSGPAPNTPPLASYEAGCTGLTCTFNALQSADPDGQITVYAWNFGDGTTGDGGIAAHTYAAAGTYVVSLSVTDNLGATGMQTKTLAAARLPMHVGDLDGAATGSPSRWTATVTIAVHDIDHSPVAGVEVAGSWKDGTSAVCTTAADGRCGVIKPGLSKGVSAGFSVSSLTHATFVYASADNHDADGDSNGTAIGIARR
jgi:PKD repeat protein